MSNYYIVRDKTDGLWLFNEKPVKGENHWTLSNGDRGKLIRQNLFSEVRWEDKEPKVLTEHFNYGNKEIQRVRT